MVRFEEKRSSGNSLVVGTAQHVTGLTAEIFTLCENGAADFFKDLQGLMLEGCFEYSGALRLLVGEQKTTKNPKNKKNTL